MKADIYSFGDSERILGKALKAYNIPRERVVILSKCCAGLPDNPGELDLMTRLQHMSVNDGVMVNRVGLSRKHIFDAVDASIARLGTYLDVLQIHRNDPDVPMEEIMKALNDVVDSGRARYIGASSVSSILWHICALFANRHRDEYLGVSSHAKHRKAERLAPIYQHARLSQLTLP